ncbi:MAG: DUF2239 family protein [Rhodanobacter sp.]
MAERTICLDVFTWVILTNVLTRIEFAELIYPDRKMSPSRTTSCIAFNGQQRIAHGALADVARVAKQALDAGTAGPLLVFDEHDSYPIEIDFRGSVDDVLARLAPDPAPAEPPRRGPGRPRLGVVPREVTLLPRHWDWLGQQPEGASAVLRRLVEQSIRHGGAKQRVRQALESVDRFMRVMAGDESGYEEASRAFYRGDRERFATLTATWPTDVREHLRQLAAVAWDERDDAG